MRCTPNTDTPWNRISIRRNSNGPKSLNKRKRTTMPYSRQANTVAKDENLTRAMLLVHSQIGTRENQTTESNTHRDKETNNSTSNERGTDYATSPERTCK